MADPRDLYRGLRCVWRTTPRGGYGYTLAIPVVVMSVAGAMVRIRVEQDGSTRLVRPESLTIQNMRLFDARLEAKDV